MKEYYTWKKKTQQMAKNVFKNLISALKKVLQLEKTN